MLDLGGQVESHVRWKSKQAVNYERAISSPYPMKRALNQSRKHIYPLYTAFRYAFILPSQKKSPPNAPDCPINTESSDASFLIPVRFLNP